MFAADGKERWLGSDYWTRSVGMLVTSLEQLISLEQQRAANRLAKQAPAGKRMRREIWQFIRLEGLSFHLWQQRPYTVVDVSYGDTSGRGVTKWNHEDAGIPGLDWNPRRGIDIAHGRAIRDLLNQLEARGNGG